MTRKRFVKLLMANGYSRNEANEEARLVQWSASVGGSGYQDRLETVHALSDLANSFSQASDAMEVLNANLKVG